MDEYCKAEVTGILVTNLSHQPTYALYNEFLSNYCLPTNLIHSRDINLGNSPNLTTLAGPKSSVRSTSSLRNSRTESGISTGEGNSSVQVLLSSDSTRALVIALSTGTVTSSSQ
jgi:hypothetical protein